MLLPNASGAGSWSWRSNAAALGAEFQLFAIDLIGDAGKSEHHDLTNIMRTREDQAALYDDIMAQLGIPGSAVVVRASEGGLHRIQLGRAPAGARRAAHSPGAHGIRGRNGRGSAHHGVQFLPLEPVQDTAFRWAFSDAPNVIAEFNVWLRLLMSETFPVKVAPLPLPSGERQSISMPTLFIFGTRDNLVGDPEAARALVSDMPDVTIEVVDAGHLTTVERPSEIAAIILGFLERGRRNE